MKMLKAFAIWILQSLIGLAFILLVVVIFAEWMAGCGETYVDSKGKTHQNECLFIKR